MKRRSLKFIACAAIMAMSLSVTACGGSDDAAPAAETEAADDAAETETPAEDATGDDAAEAETEQSRRMRLSLRQRKQKTKALIQRLQQVRQWRAC